MANFLQQINAPNEIIGWARSKEISTVEQFYAKCKNPEWILSVWKALAPKDWEHEQLYYQALGQCMDTINYNNSKVSAYVAVLLKLNGYSEQEGRAFFEEAKQNPHVWESPTKLIGIPYTLRVVYRTDYANHIKIGYSGSFSVRAANVAKQTYEFVMCDILREVLQLNS